MTSKVSKCFAFDQFWPLSIRPCHGSTWAHESKPARLPTTYTIEMTMNVFGHVNLDTQRVALSHLDDELSGLEPSLSGSAVTTDRIKPPDPGSAGESGWS